MTHHILLIGAKDHTIGKLNTLGISYTLYQNKNDITPLQLSSAKRVIISDDENHSNLLSSASALHKIDPFDIVTSFTEYGLYPAALIAQELNLPANNLAPVVLTRDKIKMRRLLNSNQLSTVNFNVCNTIEDAQSFFNSLDKKMMVLKPSAGTGSKGVFFINSLLDLEKAWQRSSVTSNSPLIAEEYLDGPEYSIEAVSFNGTHHLVAITEKTTTGFPNFIEIAHQVPAKISDEITNKIKHLLNKFLDIIGQKTGPTHTEIKLVANEPKIIESHTRTGGDQIWELVEIVTGFDMVSDTICYLLDKPTIHRAPTASAACIEFFTYENTNIESVSGLEKAREIQGVERLVCTLTPALQLGPLLSSESRQGYVLATGNCLEMAAMSAKLAKACVRVNVSV